MKEIQLTQGKVALVDDDDFEWLSQWKWSASRQGKDRWRAVRGEGPRGKQKMILMHRQIMDAKPGKEVDHRNRNPLDNQQHNLRFATRAEQCLNRRANISGASKYKGVHIQTGTNRWRVAFREKYVGLFDSEVEAAKAYDRATLEFNPVSACLNFPVGGALSRAW